MYTYKHKSKINESPNISYYHCAIQYLNDVYQFRKKTDIQFSYDQWAAEIGLNSRAHMSLICKGQRSITDKFIDLYAKSFHLKENEKSHFYLISQYSNAQNETLKKIFESRVLEEHEIYQYEMAAEQDAHFVKNPLHMAIQVLIGFQDQEMTAEKIADLLNVRRENVVLALEAIERCSLGCSILNSEGKKVWRTTKPPIKVSDSPGSAALINFHKETLKEAQEKVPSAGPDSRFRSIYFSVEPSMTEQLKEDVEDFLRKMKAKYGSNELKDKSLIKLNLQYYPIAKKSSETN